MKKLIVLSLVFALLASAAFAADIGVDVIGNVELLKGSTGKTVYDADASQNSTTGPVFKSPDIGVGGKMPRVRIGASHQNEEGTFGGWFRYDTGSWSGSPSAYGLGWWKPIDQFKLSVGGNPDGQFGADGVARWGFYKDACDVEVVKEAWEFSSSFFGGWSGAGALLTITPVEALEVNVALPFITDSGKAEDAYKLVNAQVAYTAGIGKFAITYVGGNGKFETKKAKDIEKAADDFAKGAGFDDYADLVAKTQFPGKEEDLVEALDGPAALYSAGGSTLYAYAGLTLIENLGIDIGFGYTLPVENTDTPNATITYNAPIAVGLGVNFSSGQFGLKARAQGKFAGSVSFPGGAPSYDLPMEVVFDVLPSYAVNDDMTVLLSAGIKYVGENVYGSGTAKQTFNDSLFGWHANPYIVIKNIFYAGFRVESSGAKDYDKIGQGKYLTEKGNTYINWSVPIGIVYSF